MKAISKVFGVMVALAAAGLQAQTIPAPKIGAQFVPSMRSVKIESKDFGRTVVFYTALGMKAGVNRGETQDLVWDGATGNSGLVIVSAGYASRAKMTRGGAYLMFLTPNIKAALDRLMAAGFDAPQPRAMGTMVSVAMLNDPDGNRIELMGPPVGN